MVRLFDLSRDLYGVTFVLCAFHEDSIHSRYWSLDRQKVRDSVRSLIESGSGNIVVSTDDNDIVTGCFVFGLSQQWYSSEGTFAFDLSVYILPEYSNGFTYLKMLSLGEKEARRMGAEKMILGITAGVSNDKAQRLYQIAGFSKIGTTVMKDIH